MSIFDLDTEGQQAVAQEAAANPIGIDQVTPGFFTKIPKSIGMGVMKGGAKTGDFMATVGSFFDVPGVDHSDADKLQEEIRQESLDYWTPQANEVGTAGRVLGGVSEMTLPLMLTAGNPGVMMGSQSIATGKELINQGVDAKTAVKVSTLEAGATGIGFKLPFLGSTLSSRIASGVAGNEALGITQRKISKNILNNAGYEEQAKQYDPLNLESLMIDGVMGTVFGGVAHVVSPRVKPSEVDAALTANNAKHFQHDTAPGLPADWNASIAHQEAMDAAINQQLRGEPVNVGHTGVQHENFIPRESSPAPEIPAEHVVNVEPVHNLPPELSAIPSDPSLSAADRAIETKFREQIQRDPQAAMDAYAKIPESADGKILNTDIARELSPDYLKDRTKSAAVHEPASAIVKAMYAAKLAEAPKPGELPMVVFSAGGTGAGKTTGLELTGVGDKAQIVYDSNMNSLASSSKRIDQALAAGKDVRILYTYRDPIEALTHGALPRATRQEKQFGTGRTVPINEHAKTHIGASEVVRQLAEKYANDPRVTITVVDNTYGKGKAKVSDLSVVPKVKSAHNELVGKLNEALDQQHQAGQISEAIRRGFKGEPLQQRVPDQSGSGSVRQTDGAGSGRQSEQASAGGKVDPIVSSAHEIAATSDIQVPTGELNPDGTPQTVSAKELLARSAAEIQQAHTDSKAFEAAVTCFLSKGGA